MTNRRQDGTNVVDEHALGLLIGVVHRSLHDIVGEGVAKELLNLVGRKNLVDEHTPRLGGGATDALLNDVGAELLLRQISDAPHEAAAEGLSERWLNKIEDVLHDVVAKRILNEGEGVCDEEINKSTLLVTRGMVDAALKDAASMTVLAHHNAVGANGIEDKLSILGREMVETLLDDMVAVKVLDKLHDIKAQRVDDKVGLLFGADRLNHSLQCASAMLIESDSGHRRNSVLNKDGALLISRMLEQALAEIVAEWIDHELRKVVLDFVEDDLNVLTFVLFELFLQEAAAVLIFAESVDLTNQIGDGEGVESLVSLLLGVARLHHGPRVVV